MCVEGCGFGVGVDAGSEVYLSSQPYKKIEDSGQGVYS